MSASRADSDDAFESASEHSPTSTVGSQRANVAQPAHARSDDTGSPVYADDVLRRSDASFTSRRVVRSADDRYRLHLAVGPAHVMACTTAAAQRVLQDVDLQHCGSP